MREPACVGDAPRFGYESVQAARTEHLPEYTREAQAPRARMAVGAAEPNVKGQREGRTGLRMTPEKCSGAGGVVEGCQA